MFNKSYSLSLSLSYNCEYWFLEYLTNRVKYVPLSCRCTMYKYVDSVILKSKFEYQYTSMTESIDLSRDSNHGSLVLRTSVLPTELPSLHNSVSQILGFLLTTPASMVWSYVSPWGRVSCCGVRAWQKGCGRVHVYMFATWVPLRYDTSG